MIKFINSLFDNLLIFSVLPINLKIITEEAMRKISFKTRDILALILAVLMCIVSWGSQGKNLERIRYYSWELHSATPEERMEKYLSLGARMAWIDLAAEIPSVIAEIKNLSPELRDKVLNHAKEMFKHLQVSSDVAEIEVMVRALQFYETELGFQPHFDIGITAQNRKICLGKRYLEGLKSHCKQYGEFRNEKEKNSILFSLDEIFKSGVKFQDLGISSAEEMNNLANCKY